MRFRAFIIVFCSVSALVLALGAGAYYVLGTGGASEGDSPGSKKLLQSLFPGYNQKNTALSRLTGVGDPPHQTASFLTGLPVGNAETEGFFAVMIDEAPAARPQFRAVNEAKLLFEIPAEGGVPRIMAFFSTENPPAEIGPVRSARDYFVSIAEPIASGYVHAGGSPDAINMLAITAMTNYNEGAKGFFRDKTISRPHNLFLHPAEILDTLSPFRLKLPVFQFSELPPDITLGANASRIDVNISTRNYAVAWNYLPDLSCYNRIQQYETMAFCPQNVVVLFTDIAVIAGDEKGRLTVRSTGTGMGKLFRDGMAYDISWNRVENGVFEFKDSLGMALSLRPGQTFIQVIDKPEKLAFSTPG